MEPYNLDIDKVNYTFNYDGRTSSSFSHALNGLERMLEIYDSKIPLELIFPTSNLNESQKDEINNILVRYNQKPLFHHSPDDK